MLCRVRPLRPDDLVELGVLRGPYGVLGWAHVRPYSADAEVLRSARRWWLAMPPQRGAGGPADAEPRVPVAVTGVRRQGAELVAKWQGCDAPEAVQALRGARVFVARADFPEPPDGQVYWVDLIGAQVFNREGLRLGTVLQLQNNGVHDVLEVDPSADPTGDPAEKKLRTLLIPMVDAYVDRVDVEARRIDVDWQPDW